MSCWLCDSGSLWRCEAPTALALLVPFGVVEYGSDAEFYAALGLTPPPEGALVLAAARIRA